MKFINEWAANAKQDDKFKLNLRIGKFTIVAVHIDLSLRFFKITLLNFSIEL